MVFGLIFLLLILVTVAGVAIKWLYDSGRNYGAVIRPGDTYKVGDGVYELPNLELPDGKVAILKEEYLIEQKQLFERLTKILSDKLEWWASGGTLLGFVRHGTFIPWDDDCDIHTHWKYRAHLFSDEFYNLLRQHGLETVFLTGVSLKRANKEAAAVRVRKSGTITPICDIFFVKLDPESGKYRKVDSWSNGEPTFNKKETWSTQDMFPLQRQIIDGLEVYLPAKPENVLTQQYGPEALTVMRSRSRLLSHRFPFATFRSFWKRRPAKS